MDTEMRSPIIEWSNSYQVSVAFVGAAYVLGVIVVLTHLSNYGVSSLSLFRLQYFIAGFWVAVPLVAVLAVSKALEVKESLIEAAQFRQGHYLRRVLLIVISDFPAWVIVGMFALGLSWLGLRTKVFGAALTNRRTLAVIAFCFGIVWSYRFAVTLRKGAQEGERSWARSVFAAYSGLLCPVLLVLYVLYFARELYPRIPYALGGGEPIEVCFVVREGNQDAPLLLDQSGLRSIPYKLLVASENTYVVLSPNKGELSFEFSKDSVKGMVVLQREASSSSLQSR